jgi:hypothetical protein
MAWRSPQLHCLSWATNEGVDGLQAFQCSAGEVWASKLTRFPLLPSLSLAVGHRQTSAPYYYGFNMGSNPKGPCIKDLVSGMVVLGGAVDL